MDYPLLNQEGAAMGTVELRADVFGLEPNEAVVHQALLRQLANARQGTHDAKTRGEVEGSTKKIYRQKGTGRARQGAIRAPHRRGGGVAFGPTERRFRQAMPKKMRRLAIRSVLSAKAKEGELVLVDELNFPVAKTKAMNQVLQALKLDGSILIATEEPKQELILSARNVENVFTLPASLLSVGTMLSHRYLVLTLAAARRAEALWGLSEAAEKEA